MALVFTNDAGTGPGLGGTRPVFAKSGGRALQVASGTFAFDNSYPTGGEATTAFSSMFTSLAGVFLAPTSGYTFEYDYTNNKVLAYKDSKRLTAAVDPASLATDAVANTQITLTGAATTDDVIAIPPVDLEAGLVCQSAWVSGANTVQVRIQNVSAGTVDGASKTWAFIVRPKSGVGVEVADTTDLSALTAVRAFAWGI